GRRRILELAILDQLLHEFAARVGDIVGFFESTRRQKHPALDFHQGRGHHNEIAGQFHVEYLQQLQVFEELLGEGGDGNVEDIDLVPLDEVKEQIERSVESIERD